MSNTRKGDEYPSKSGIIISPKTNPSGSRAYRVDIPSTITGRKREQRQFQAIDDARQYAGQRHLEITQFGHTAFALTAGQRNDATRAIALLKAYGLTLEGAARLAVKHMPEQRGGMTVTMLRAAFLKAPGRRKGKLTSRRTHSLRSLKWRTARFEKAFGAADVSSITTKQVKEWLPSLGDLAPVSVNNFRRALHAMFSYAVAEGYCTTNPLAKIPLYHVPETSPAILSVDQAKRLIDSAADTDDKLGLLSYVTLGLFAGLRRAELERLDWSAVKIDRNMVTIDGNIAKTGSIRNVTLAQNALDWLSLSAVKTGRVTPRNLNQRLRRLRFIAGINKWHGNELRHSFASYHFDLHQNAPLTAAMLGHTSGTQLLFQHYRSLVPLGEGERYFAIAPRCAAHLQTASQAQG